MELLREAFVDALRKGLPIVGAVVGSAMMTRRYGDDLKVVAAGAGAGYAAGWATQKLILWGAEKFSAVQMPTTAAPPLQGMRVPSSDDGYQRVEYQDPSHAYDAARANVDSGVSAQDMYGAPSGNMGGRPMHQGEKGSGEGVRTAQVANQTGQEAQVSVPKGTFFADAFGGQMGI